MPPRSNVPIRICGSKTRTGCKTCKQRHLKCDERRPICQRCQKSNRYCFYDRPQSEAPRSRTLQQIPHHDQGAIPEIPVLSRYRSYPTSLSPSSDISPFGSYELAEICAVKNFVAYLGKELAGSFADDVWCYICPQVAQYEPLIWSAMVAVSMLDTSIRLGHDRSAGNTDLNTAIRQYSKALQELNTQLGKSKDEYNGDVVLLSCLLFAVFECLQSHVASALRHISGGMKLLIEWGNEAKSNSQYNSFGYLNRAQLLPIFFSLDSQAIQMGVVSFRHDFAKPAIDNQLQIPGSFTSIQDAHLSLNHIFNRLSHWGQWKEPSIGCGDIPDDSWLIVEEHTLRSQLAAWDTAFETPLKLCFYKPATVLLLVQRKVIEVFFEKQADGPSEMEYDKYLPLFEEAVEYTEAYMKLSAADTQSHVQSIESRSPKSSKARPNFTVAMDIVMSLFHIVTKCRNLVTRRRALSMLKACGRKEGIFDSYSCAILAERIIALEESAALSNGHIPESARVYEFDTQLREDTGADVVYRMFVQDKHGFHRIETVKEKVIW